MFLYVILNNVFVAYDQFDIFPSMSWDNGN